MNVNASDVYHFMPPSFEPQEDHITNDPLNLSLSMFEVKDSNVTLNINQMMSPNFGEDIVGLLEDQNQDQDQRSRTR